VPTWQLTTTGIVWEMLGTERMPFFPSMRVIGRVHAEPWKEVFGRMAAELQGETARRHECPVDEPPAAAQPAVREQPIEAAPSAAEINQMLGLFNQGRYAELEPLARGLTARFPQHGFTWKLLGAALRQMGRTEDALVPMQQAAALLPDDFEAHYNLGNALRKLRRLSEAEASYLRVLTLKPDFAETHCNLGATLEEMGRLEEAESSYRRALLLKPDYAEAHSNLGNVLQGQGRMSEAEASYRRALEVRSEYAEAHGNLGKVLQGQGRFSEAEASFRQALEIRPDYAEALSNLGDALREQGRSIEAEVVLRQALNVAPDSVRAFNLLGITLIDLWRLPEGEASFRRALELQPDFVEGHSNLGNALRYQGQLFEAEASYNRAIELRSDYFPAHWNRAMTLFAMGRLAEAWEGFDWRLLLPSIAPHVRDYGKRKWAGEDLSGEGIVVWPEQGVGDEIEYAGVIPDLAGRARRVVVECDPRLVSLFARSFPGVEVVERRDPPDARIMDEDLGWQVPMGGLLRWFRPTLESFPKQAGYLRPDPQRVAHWRARVDALGGGLKVGIGWRSMHITPGRAVHYSRLEEDWGSVLGVPGVHFVNLQYDECRAELEQARERFGVGIHAFADLDLMRDLEGAAALTSVLDLVISPPTTVAILAGALGVPTWQLTTTGIVWETLGTDRMPFFPSMRVVNRDRAESWKVILARVATELRAYSAQELGG